MKQYKVMGNTPGNEYAIIRGWESLVEPEYCWGTFSIAEDAITKKKELDERFLSYHVLIRPDIRIDEYEVCL